MTGPSVPETDRPTLERQLAAWQAVLAAAAILVVYTNAPRIAWDAGLIPLPPAAALATVALAALPLFTSRIVRPALESPLWIWAMLYAAFGGAAFFWSSQSPVALGALGSVFEGACTIGVFLILFSSRRALRSGQSALIAATLFAAVVNLYEIVRPGAFSHFPGRSAGFYLNPNIAGSAIVYGLVLTLSGVRPSLRPWYVMLTGLGVLVTLSRSSILCWILAVVLLRGGGAFKVGWRVWGTLATAALVALAALPHGTLGLATELISSAGREQFSRLGVGSQSVLSSVSISSRARVAALAWETFEEHPLIGKGTGATLEWSEDQSTHNMYLKFMAENGALGLLVYPLALVAALWRVPRGLRPTVLAFGCTWLVFGLFTHNELENRHVLIALAYVAGLCVVSRRESRALVPEPGFPEVRLGVV